MQTIAYRLTLLCAAFVVLFTSCEEDEFTKYEGQYVAFQSAAAALEESQTVATADGEAVITSNIYRVEIVRSSPDISEPLTVNIAVTSQYLDETPFSLPGEDASDQFVIGTDVASVTIPAGEYTAEFLVTTVNDVTPSGNKEVVMTITGVSDDSYNIGFGESNIRKSFTLDLIDDDCPIDLETDFAGEWEVKSFCAAPGSFNDGFCVNSQVGKRVTLAVDPSDVLGTTALLTGGIHAEPFPLKFVTCPQQVIFNGDYALTYNQNGSTAYIFPPDEPEIYGTGSYNPETGRISVVVTYGNAASGGVFDEFVIEYEKVQE